MTTTLPEAAADDLLRTLATTTATARALAHSVRDRRVCAALNTTATALHQLLNVTLPRQLLRGQAVWVRTRTGGDLVGWLAADREDCLEIAEEHGPVLVAVADVVRIARAEDYQW